MKRKYTPRNSAAIKTALLVMAKSGHKRPHHASYLGDRLEAYITVGRNLDEKFASEIRFAAPDWFPELRIKKIKTTLLQMAKSGQPKPPTNTHLGVQLRLFLGNGRRHDEIFTKEIRKYWN